MTESTSNHFSIKLYLYAIIWISFYVSFAQKVTPTFPILHGGNLTYCDVSPDLRWLLTTSEDSKVKIWDMRSQACITTFSQHSDEVTKAIFFQPTESDQLLVVSISKDQKVYVFNPVTNQIITEFSEHESEVKDVVFNVKQQLLFTKDMNTTIGWNPLTGELKIGYNSRYNERCKLFSTPELFAQYELTGNGRLDTYVRDHSTRYINHNPYSEVDSANVGQFQSDDYFLGSIKYDETSGSLLYPMNNTHFFIEHVEDAEKAIHSAFSKEQESFLYNSYSEDAQLLDANFGLNQSINGITNTATYSYDLVTKQTRKHKLPHLARKATVNRNNQAVVIFRDTNIAQFEPSETTVLYDFLENQIVDTISYVQNFNPYKTRISHGDTIALVQSLTSIIIYDLKNQKLLFNRDVFQESFSSMITTPELSSYYPFTSDIPFINGWDLRNLSYEPDSTDYDVADAWGDVDYKQLEEEYSSFGEFKKNSEPVHYNKDSTIKVSYSEYHKANTFSYLNPSGHWISLGRYYTMDPNLNSIDQDPMFKIESFNTNCFVSSNTLLSVGLDENVHFITLDKVRVKKKSQFLSNNKKGVLVGWVSAPIQIKLKNKLVGHNDLVTSVALSSDSTMAATTSMDNSVIIWDLNTKKIKHRLIGHDDNSNLALFIDNDTRLVTFGRDLKTIIWDVATGEAIAKLIVVQNFELHKIQHAIVTPDNYYSGDQDLIQDIIFKLNDKIYTFEQFDLKYNRPDIVLSRLGYADSTLVEAYKVAYLKRLKKMGFTEEMLLNDLNIPELQILNFMELPPVDNQGSIKLNLHLKDSKYALDRINVWVNDVAVFGKNGISLRSKNTKETTEILDVNLVNGMNKIQVSTLNQAGIESYKETVSIKSMTGKAKPDLYLIAIGESKFKDESFNLTYAAKDAKDIATLFKDNALYGNVYQKILTNENVTKENILSLKDFLTDADINDQVIIFLAGHGVLDNNLDYFFATYDMDFSSPSDHGIAYSDLESLLDGIAPLRKTMLIDACHSGEIDKDEVLLTSMTKTDNGNIKFRAIGNTVKSKLGVENISELSKALFSDLRKGTGATVISSSGGMEFALEGEDWKNGLFTYCLISGITSKKADLDQNGEIWLSEIKTYVEEYVEKLSGGMQKPTSRIENQTIDFRIW